MKLTAFIREISSISLPNVFNPYHDTCPQYDQPDAPKLRQKNLHTVLQSLLDSGVETVWIGRDLGYRGGRRTGLALTDERHLACVAHVYPGARATRATYGDVAAERTAAEIWAVLPLLDVPPLLWNVFPYHPHEPGEPMSNRKFTSRELAQVEDLNAQLFTGLGIRRAISIGQDAAAYAARFGLKVLSVRHPSYGGTTEFRHGIARLYGLPAVRQSHPVRQSALF